MQEAFYVNKGSCVIIVFFVFFPDLIEFLMAETNEHYNQYSDTQQRWQKNGFLMWQCRGCTTLQQFLIQFYSNMMKHSQL